MKHLNETHTHTDRHTHSSLYILGQYGMSLGPYSRGAFAPKNCYCCDVNQFIEPQRSKDDLSYYRFGLDFSISDWYFEQLYFNKYALFQISVVMINSYFVIKLT